MSTGLVHDEQARRAARATYERQIITAAFLRPLWCSGWKRAACGLALDDERVPRAAYSLALDANGAGWTVRLDYAHGMRYHATHGRPLGMAGSVSVSLVHADGRRAQAFWVDGKADHAKVWRTGELPRRVGFSAGKNSAPTLKDWLG